MSNIYRSLSNRLERLFSHFLKKSALTYEDITYCSFRYVEERSETLTIRQDIMQPLRQRHDVGIMVFIIAREGMGYAATSDLSDEGLLKAFRQAWQWVNYAREKMVFNFAMTPLDLTEEQRRRGEKEVAEQADYYSQIRQSWRSASLGDKLDILRHESARCRLNDKIVDWQISLRAVEIEQHQYGEYRCPNNRQVHHYLIPYVRVVAHDGGETQYRTLGGHGVARQGGLEILSNIGFYGSGERLAEEALQLLSAPNCPTGCMDVMLAPDQMMLQIHESIGHPLELDRILGDERNFAGTSFVTLDMFGNYQYGSPLLNVTFDPTIPEQIASYKYDDEGVEAKKVHIIQNGILMRPLGSHLSQLRAGLPGVANARAASWNRPPIDRMANLNVEPGTSSFEEMVSAIDNGIVMKSNSSWSIDDSRNKFQFGCEWGQLIKNGKLTTVVKNPNYRGISATFWRNLKHVGNLETFQVLGLTNCGKGEPNQMIHVGHASPACVFSNVDVFGGV
jgi:predicted Zn-dependent protease